MQKLVGETLGKRERERETTVDDREGGAVAVRAK